jgi:hypothetical protein
VGERLLADCQCAFVERLGLGVAALLVVEQGQVVEAGGDSGMIGPQRLLVDCQRALVERLGLGVATLRAIELGQVVEADGIVDAVRAGFGLR